MTDSDSLTRKNVEILGYMAAIVFFGCWILGIILDGSWTYGTNALSDLGVSENTAATLLFNLGVCILSAVIWTAEMVGIFLLGDRSCKAYACLTTVSMIFLFLVGVFTEDSGDLHGTVATTYGLFAALEMSFCSVCGFFNRRRIDVVLTVIMLVADAVMYFNTDFAFFEANASILAGIWSVLVAYRFGRSEEPA